MKRVLMMLVAGTVLSGLAAAYATTTQRVQDAAIEDSDVPDVASPFDAPAEAIAARN